MTRVVAFTGDLMDRSRLEAALPSLEFARAPEDASGADCVIVDLATHAEELGRIRALAPAAHLVAFGPHVDEAALDAARAAGADVVLPRSQLFRDPAAAVLPG
jgi:DNA-binding NarL/FixJ family response regulator